MTVTRAINQGDIYWIQPEYIQEAEPGDFPHPYVGVGWEQVLTIQPDKII